MKLQQNSIVPEGSNPEARHVLVVNSAPQKHTQYSDVVHFHELH